MTIQACYERMHADFDGVIRRMGNQERVERFLRKLPDDKSFSSLCASFASENGEEAFRAAHSLKGICMNLGLTELFTASAALTEEMRGGAFTQEARRLFRQTAQKYEEVVSCIRELDESVFPNSPAPK